jgi:hypothetical protein
MLLRANTRKVIRAIMVLGVGVGSIPILVVRL